jgi:NAD(P)H-dependent FMN reductase
MNKPKILAFSGSARVDSFNQRLVICAAQAAVDAGAEVRVINLREFPMPIMDQDLEREHGQPEHAARFKQLLVEHDGILLASPEYNSSISPLLKNTLDWVSRKVGEEPAMVAYKGKVAALLSASPGRLGGIRGLVHVRSILSNLGVMVLPDQVAVASAGSAFDESGKLVNDYDISRINDITARFVTVLNKLHEE